MVSYIPFKEFKKLAENVLILVVVDDGLVQELPEVLIESLLS